VLDYWDASPDLSGTGVGYLLYGLLDNVVDSHFAAVQALDDTIENLEDLLFSSRPQDRDVQRRSFELRKSLVLLRRIVLPMREVVNSLMRRDLPALGPDHLGRHHARDRRRALRRVQGQGLALARPIA
jgi:magnesium transporter